VWYVDVSGDLTYEKQNFMLALTTFAVSMHFIIIWKIEAWYWEVVKNSFTVVIVLLQGMNTVDVLASHNHNNTHHICTFG